MQLLFEEDILELPDVPILVAEVVKLLERYHRYPGDSTPRSVTMESNDNGYGTSTLVIPLIRDQHAEFELVTTDSDQRFRHGCRSTFCHKLSRMSGRAALPATLQHLLDAVGLSGRDTTHVYNEKLTLAAVYNHHLCLYFCTIKDKSV